jgi:tRNA U34 5-methylaminomethyl-2-thiouridine-forming methyltransferase MnmC
MFRKWVQVMTQDGTPTLRHPLHHEACHSLSGAWLESRERYARACSVESRTRARSPLRLLDVGTGLGLNLAAALEAVNLAGGELEVVTLELEDSILRAAVELAPAMPPQVRAWHTPIARALESALDRGEGPIEICVEPGRDARERSHLTLLLGDARTTLAELPPEQAFDVVFLDPFSPRVAPELWDVGFLSQVAARMGPGSLLSTYSASLGVRAALCAVGLQVGVGGRVGAKAQGTLAAPDHDPGGFDERTRRRIVRRARQGAPHDP